MRRQQEGPGKERAEGGRKSEIRRTPSGDYEADFKQAAVERVENGEQVMALSRELGVKRSSIYRWITAYRTEGRAGLERGRGRPRPGDGPPARDPQSERVRELERLLGQQAAELDFFEQAFDALGLPKPAPSALGATRSSRFSRKSSAKAPH